MEVSNQKVEKVDFFLENVLLALLVTIFGPEPPPPPEKGGEHPLGTHTDKGNFLTPLTRLS